MRWNESHSVSHLPPILLCCLSPVLLRLGRPRPPFSSRSLNPPTTSESLFHSGSLSLSLCLSSLPSTVPPFSSFLSSINPQPSFSFSPSPPPSAYPPQHVHARAVERAIHTCTRAHVHTAPRFLLVAANTLRQRGRPLLVQRGRKGEGADGRGDTILPSCRGRDIFSLSRDNLETGVALPARESSEGARVSGPGQNAHPLSPPFTPFSRPPTLSRSFSLSFSHYPFLLKVEGSSRLLRDFSPRKITGKPFLCFLVARLRG